HRRLDPGCGARSRRLRHHRQRNRARPDRDRAHARRLDRRGAEGTTAARCDPALRYRRGDRTHCPVPRVAGVRLHHGSDDLGRRRRRLVGCVHGREVPATQVGGRVGMATVVFFPEGAFGPTNNCVGIDDVGPDVIVEDNVVGFPALPASERPWVRIVSCNPAELKDSDVPPTFSGYSADDRSGWGEFRAEYERTHRDLWNDFDAFMRSSGAPPLPDLEFIHESPALNLFLYPEEADYSRARRLGPTWHRLDSCVRATEDEWPELAAFEGDGLLVYLSLGSLGSADVDLMRRLVATLADSPHRFVVSKGPQHDRYELADNMRGAEFLPQTTILRHVDLVITHGGNNTVTECFHFGTPMIVLPLFWDQYDNAQRVDELGLGVRLDTYGHEPDELRGAVRSEEHTSELQSQSNLV